MQAEELKTGDGPQTVLLNLHPLEVLVFILSEDLNTPWKENAIEITKTISYYELIPSNKTPETCTELIGILFLDKSVTRELTSIENTIEFLRDTALGMSEKKVEWKLIKKSKSEVIYEILTYEILKNTPPQHSICKALLTDYGLYIVTINSNEIIKEEKEKWINALENSLSITNMEEPNKLLEETHNVERRPYSLLLGPAFANWKVISAKVDDCRTQVIWAPPYYNKGYLFECVEVVTVPWPRYPIETLIDKEREFFKILYKKEPKFSILKKAKRELVYSFTHPKDHLLVTCVVRGIISDGVYYNIRYQRGLPNQMTNEKILQWKERLESIKIP